MTQDNSTRNPKLDDAIRAVRDDQPDESQFRAAAERLYERMQSAAGDNATAVEQVQIHGCAGIERLLPAYRSGTLAASRALLVESHLRECVACRRRAMSLPVEKDIRWAAPLPMRSPGFPRRGFAVAAAVIVLAVSAFLVNQFFFVAPAGARATVQSADGQVYRLASGAALAAGEQLGEGEMARTAPGAHAFIRLMDGSTVEINERTSFALQARGKNLTLDLDEGAVIVQAAKRQAGHLYVRTPDCRVAVTGTVFSVKSGLKGSRVLVIRGEVKVAHGGRTDTLHPGDQVATSASITPVSMREEIAWSSELEKHIDLLGQFASLRKQIDAIPAPAPRYSSDLLPRVPGQTVLYGSIPNAGQTLAEANRIFQQQLQQSDALRDWWMHGRDDSSKELNEIIGKVQQLSQYLGDELVLVGVNRQNGPGVAVLAGLRRSDVRAFLDAQFAAKDLRTLDEHDLATVTPAMVQRKLLALVRQDVVVFASDLDVLGAVNLQLNQGPSSFAQSEFGQRITDAYSRGAGYLLAVNLQQISQNARQAHPHPRAEAELDRSGLGDARYLIAEHREINGVPDGHLTLDFTGQRRGIASWLAAPAPMGSLEFVSRHAGLALAFVAKQPADMMRDLVQMAPHERHHHSEEAEQQFVARLQELVTYLGGDATFALDGPVLPTPAWKMVVQVYDPVRLQASIDQLVQQVNEEAQRHGKPGIDLQREEVAGQPFFVVRSLSPEEAAKEVHYTYAAGYMIVAGSRAVVMNALQTRTNGDSLSRSAEFLTLLPTDANTSYSAVAYQNVGPILQPLASQLSPEKLPALQQLAGDARPSAICAYGGQTRIDVASKSKLLGGDFFTVMALLKDVAKLNKN